MALYNHINDCWNDLFKAKTIAEAVELCEGFPRWSGDWEVYSSMGDVLATNTWFDADEGTWQERTEFLNFSVSNDTEDI